MRPPPPFTLTVSGVHSAAQSQSFHQIVRHTGMRGRGGLDKTTLVRHPLVTTTIILHFDQDILVVTSWRELDGREEANLNVGRWYFFGWGQSTSILLYEEDLRVVHQIDVCCHTDVGIVAPSSPRLVLFQNRGPPRRVQRHFDPSF